MRELSITCELLKRRSQKKIMGFLLAYIAFFIFVRLLTPHYSKNGEVLYRGLLSQFDYGDYIIYAHYTYYFLLISAPFVFTIIIKNTLTIIGDITITEHNIIISHKLSILYKLNVSHLKHLEIQFNYFKRNDFEPRNMIKGNNNVIGFKKWVFLLTLNFYFKPKRKTKYLETSLTNGLKTKLSMNTELFFLNFNTL